MWIFIFLLGLSVGSFINVLIDRLPKNESIVKKRSHCDSCKKTLGFLDLIPVLSFIILKEKCRYCHSPISIQYPIVELLTGFLFLLIFVVFGGIREIRVVGFYFFIVSSFIAIFFIDLKEGIIPDKIIYPAILISLVFLIFQYHNILISHLLSAFGACLFFFFLLVATRGRGMGFGDVKLVFLMGLLLGFPKIIVALYVAFLTGAILGIILVLCRVKKLGGGTLPFGPFLVLGTLGSLFWGDFLVRYTFSFLFR